MTKIRKVDFGSFCAINTLYLAYKDDPLSPEKHLAFVKALSSLAEALAPRYRTKRRVYGNISGIYYSMYEYASLHDSTDFLSDVIPLIERKFGNSN